MRVSWLDLDLTMYPSFVRALMRKLPDGSWIRSVGRWAGCKIKIARGELVCDCLGVGVYWSGAWFNPHERAYLLRSEGARALLRAFRGLSLAVDPFERELIFIPIFLSRRTDYEANVLRWCDKLWRELSRVKDVAELKVEAAGASYQLKQLREILPEFLSRRIRDIDDPWEARRELLRLKFVGPKVADAYLLFTGLDTSSAPVDTHLVKVANRLGLARWSRTPQKSLCAKHTCDECPASDSCLRSVMAREYGEMAGWVQTAAYVLDRLYCSRRRCGECGVSSVCKEAR